MLACAGGAHNFFPERTGKVKKILTRGPNLLVVDIEDGYRVGMGVEKLYIDEKILMTR